MSGVKAETSHMSYVVAIAFHGFIPGVTNCSALYAKDTETNTDHSFGFIVGVQQYSGEWPRVYETKVEARLTLPRGFPSSQVLDLTRL